MRKYLCMDMKEKKTGKGNNFPTNCREVQQMKDMEINEKIRYFRKQRGLSQDTEMMNLAFKKYLGVQMNKKDKPSIMKKLMHFKDAVSKGKNRERAREQQKDRGQSL